jgi:hypothetical protein
MSDESRIKAIPIDRAFQFVVIQAWDELAKLATPHCVRVEYLRATGKSLDHVSVWLTKDQGYQDLVCEYWMWNATTHSNGFQFEQRYCSEKLAHGLSFVMENQEEFPLTANGRPDNLVLVFPPTQQERTESATWMAGIPAPHFTKAEL